MNDDKLINDLGEVFDLQNIPGYNKRSFIYTIYCKDEKGELHPGLVRHWISDVPKGVDQEKWIKSIITNLKNQYKDYTIEINKPNEEKL